MKSTRYDVITIGNYTKDTVVSAAGTRYVDGGGFNYAAHAAAVLGIKVAAVTRLAAEDFHVVEALKRAGIDVYPEATAASTLMRLEYPSDNPDERTLTVATTAGSFSTEQVASREAKAFVISGSIRDEVPLEVIKAISGKRTIVSADVQGFIRIREADGTLRHAEWPERREVLAEIDILKTDAVEAESLTGESDIRAAAIALEALGPREIVLTHRDGILVRADERFHEASFYPKKLIGRSGRGDSCLGSYVAKRLTAPPEEAIVWSAALTSLKMEAEGPIARDRSEVAALIRERYR